MRPLVLVPEDVVYVIRQPHLQPVELLLLLTGAEGFTMMTR
jgi:hypothetical protein